MILYADVKKENPKETLSSSIYNYHSRHFYCVRLLSMVCSFFYFLNGTLCFSWFANRISYYIIDVMWNVIPHAVTKWVICYSCVVMREPSKWNVQKFSNCKRCVENGINSFFFYFVRSFAHFECKCYINGSGDGGLI